MFKRDVHQALAKQAGFQVFFELDYRLLNPGKNFLVQGFPKT